MSWTEDDTFNKLKRIPIDKELIDVLFRNPIYLISSYMNSKDLCIQLVEKINNAGWTVKDLYKELRVYYTKINNEYEGFNEDDLFLVRLHKIEEELNNV